MTPAARWALRAYPPSFRDRYGGELAALVEDLPPSGLHTAGLFAGAARAWVRPAFSGADATRGRLQASVLTVWAAWCAGFLLAPAAFKAVLDPPAPQVDETVRRLLDASAASFALGCAIAAVGGSLLATRTMLPALRDRRWSVLRPLAPVVVLGLLEVAGLLALALLAPTPTPLVVVVAGAWLVGLAALLVSLVRAPAVLLERLRPDTVALRLPAVLAAGLALCLAALTATSASAVLLSGDAALVGAFAPVAVVVSVGVVAALSALVSAGRGVRALRARTG